MVARLLASLIVSALCFGGLRAAVSGIYRGLTRRSIRVARQWPVSLRGQPFVFAFFIGAWSLTAVVLAAVWLFSVRAFLLTPG